jgi:t-SNARE complex subunit (syntaxin)
MIKMQQEQEQDWRPYLSAQNELIAERDRAITGLLEQQIELRDLQVSVADLVSHQGHLVDDIRSHVTHSNENCKNAKADIEKRDKNDAKKSDWGLFALIATVTGVISTSILSVVIFT